MAGIFRSRVTSRKRRSQTLAPDMVDSAIERVHYTQWLTKDARDEVYHNDHEDTLNWAREVAQEELPGMVLLPSRQVEIGKRCTL